MKNPVQAFLHLILDLILFALMLLGVVGIVFKFIMPEGWLSEGWDLMWKKNPGYAFFFILAAILAFVFGKRWLDTLNLQARSGNFIAYAWALLGVYFAVKLGLTGTI